MKWGEKAFFSQESRRDREIRRQLERERRKEDRQFAKMWKYFGKRLVNAFIQQQMMHVTSEKTRPNIFQRLKGRKRRQLVKLVDPFWNSQELWYRVKTEDGFLPWGTNIADFLKPELVEDLKLSVMRGVRIEYDQQRPWLGLWVVVEPFESVRGLPTELMFSKAIEMIPDSRPPLTFVLGAIEGGGIKLLNLEDFPHLLLAGATGYGKSNMERQIITTFVKRNSPRDIQLYLFDMKHGGEFQPFRNLPHVAKFVERKEDVLPALDELHQIVRDRWDLFKTKGKLKLRDWNATQRDQKLPVIAAIFDELGTVMLDKKYRNDVEAKISDLASICRSAGICLIVSTQRPSSDVITGLIKVNFDGRIAFSMPSGYDSRTVLDIFGAEGLRGHKGRAVFMEGVVPIEAQTPLLTDAVRDDYLRQIRSDNNLAEDDSIQVRMEDVLLYGLEQLDGKLPYRVLLEEFSPLGLTEPKLMDMLREAERRGAVIDGQPYRVIPGKQGKSRRIEKVRQSALQTILKGKPVAETSPETEQIA